MTPEHAADALIRCACLLAICIPGDSFVAGNAAVAVPLELPGLLASELRERFGGSLSSEAHGAILDLIDSIETASRIAFYVPDVSPGQTNAALSSVGKSTSGGSV